MSAALAPGASAAAESRAARVSGHFGEWLQGRLGPGGPLALVTVPCPDLAVTVRRHDGAFGLETEGPAILTEAQARGLLAALGRPAAGRYAFAADMPPGGGAGASTAALVALARAAGARATPEALAAACLAAEGASDPLMHAAPDTLLWAPRSARILDRLPRPPAAEVVGGFRGAPQRTDPADTDFPDIADLVAEWREAAARGDLAALAALASESARRTSRRRGPTDDPLPGLAAATGALGWLRAHTGSAGGLVFPPGHVPPGAAEALRAAGYARVLRFRTGAA
ncbi:propanediol utilization protein [Roseivivax sp. CAU 1761]